MHAEVIIPSKSESVQVDSLITSVESPPSPSLSPQVNQSSRLSPSAALLHQHPSASYKLEFQVPSHYSQASLHTGTGFVHIFDTPNEIVEEELKDLEMNRTIPSLDVHKSYEAAASEDRKSEKSLGYVKDEYDRMANSFHEKQVLQTSDEIGGSDIRELESSSYSAQKLVDDQLNSVPFVSSVPNEIQRNNNMTMDKLYQEFCMGNISLDEFHQMIINIPEEVEDKEDSLPETNKRSIESLEQQVLEAAQSISESQHLVSRVRLLMEATETAETDKPAAQSHRSCKMFSSNSSHRQHNDVNVASSSREFARCQEALSMYRKQGKIDTLIQFLNDVDFENITSDMVDEIIECESNIKLEEVKKMSGSLRTDENTSLHQKRNKIFAADKKQPTGIGEGLFTIKGANHQHPAQEEVPSAVDSELTRTEEWQKSFASDAGLSELHLDLASMR